MEYCALIVAAGSGTRMKLGFNKVYALTPAGKTILETTMSVFLDDPDCRNVIIVTDADEYRRHHPLLFNGRISIAKGGATRQESVHNGLQAVITPYVFIHDGARPYLDRESLERLKEAMKTERAALLTVPCKDTIKEVIDGYVVSTPDRSLLQAAQTPQAFETELIISCMEKAIAEGFTGTDDTSLVERYADVRVKAVEGSYANIKITTPEDLK